MANISFQLNTTTSFTTAANAIANWGNGNVITAWADMAGADLANGETVYQNNDENPDAASGTLSNAFVGNADFFAFEKSDGTIAAVQIDAAGLVSTLTTTTTTAAPPLTYTISVTDANGNTPAPLEFNEGDEINVTIQASTQGSTTDLTVSGTAVEADFSTWPTEIGTGNTTATLDFTNANTVPLQFDVSNDLSDNTNSGGSPEGSETIVFTLTDGTTETITIIDSSQNQPPTTSNINATIVQTGLAGNFVTIDLSGETIDPEGNPNSNLEWLISDIPGNGDFRDPVDVTTALTVSDLPHTLSGYEVLYFPGTTFIGTETVTGWTVSDPNGGQSNTSDIILTVTAPTNQPPNATDVSTTISGTGANVVFNFDRDAADDEIGGALQAFQWWDGNPGSASLTLAQLNATLTYGLVEINANGTNFPESWKYTTNTNAALTPGASSVDDTFYFLATDAAGLTDVGQIQIQITEPGNTAPDFDVTPPGTIAINQGTAHVINNITASDADGHTFTIIKQSQGGSDTGATATFNNGTLTVVGSSAGSVTVTLRVTDEFGLFDANNDITYTFTVAEVPYRSIRHSSFSNSDAAACGLERPISTIYYYNTGNGGTTFLANLQLGDFLYQDSGLSLPVIPSSSNSAWVSLEETSQQTIKAAKLNATTGAIEEFLNCTITGGNAWSIIVRYSENSSLYCGGLYEEGEAWQNVADGATLTDVVSVGGQLFPDEYSANQYVGIVAPTDRILADGIYNQEDDIEIPTRGYYFYNNGWATNPSPEPNDPTNDPNSTVNRLYVCPPDIVYQTKSLDCYFFSQDPANISAVCNAMTEVDWNDSKLNFNAITIYYRQDVNDNDTWSLLDIAKNQALVYINQNAADTLNYSLLQPTSVLLDFNSGGFVLWDNNEFTGYAG
jgi:hypothetical protein